MKTAEQCYEALGLDPNASDEEVRKTYRALAKKHHPDVNKEDGAKDRFVEIQQAYDAIINKKFASNNPLQGGFNPFDFGFGSHDFGTFSTNKNFHQQDFNKTMALTISFIEACLGSTKTISFNRQIQCEICQEYQKTHGKLNISSCETCGGRGMFARQIGPVHITQPCAPCGAKGIMLECDGCHGLGSTPKKQQISFKINAGVNSGAVLRLAEQGDFNYRLNKYGDLFINVSVASHPKMTRNGLDIFSRIGVPYLDCILGAEVEFDSIHGKDIASVPPLTSAGSVIKRSNAGINKIGSHILTIDVVLPTFLTPPEKKLLNKIKKLKFKK